jgi:hypothetical protein
MSTHGERERGRERERELSFLILIRPHGKYLRSNYANTDYRTKVKAANALWHIKGNSTFKFY